MKKNIIFDHQLTSFVTKDSSEIREFCSPDMSDVKSMSLAEALIKPGNATIGHRHVNFEEIYFIMSGIGKMILGEETVVVGPRDTIAIPENTYHKIYNIGDEDLSILCSCSPRYTDEGTVLDEE